MPTLPADWQRATVTARRLCARPNQAPGGQEQCVPLPPDWQPSQGEKEASLLRLGHLSSQRVRGGSEAPALHVPFLSLLGQSEVLYVSKKKLCQHVLITPLW